MFNPPRQTTMVATAPPQPPPFIPPPKASQSLLTVPISARLGPPKPKRENGETKSELRFIYVLPHMFENVTAANLVVHSLQPTTISMNDLLMGQSHGEFAQANLTPFLDMLKNEVVRFHLTDADMTCAMLQLSS